MNGGRIWLVIGGVLAVAIIGLGWLVGASPLFAQAASADSQRADVEANNEQLKITLAGMKKLDDQKDDLLDELDELRTNVPTVAELEDYFDWVAVASTAAAVSLTVANAGEPQLVAVADGAPASFSEGLKKSLYLIPIHLEVGGNADQMNAFLELLQTDGRLQLLNRVGIDLGTSLSGSIDGYIFVVYDPTVGPIVSPGDEEAAGDGAEGDTAAGDEAAAGTEEGAEQTPDPSSTPTPPAPTPSAAAR
ncbi:hypothetical protein [Protaetiibacter larvae]|uniref:hypothetical protein n=1 Tax=Protaetiibacter larvae TaxID=2592654 RepID=UPI00143D4A27|nr:hypothetical protein [Protaetiibacter larvae]